jgi:predicted permease
LEQDFRDEVDFHLALREEQLRGAGLDNARARATRKFGNTTRIQEALRETWALALPGSGIAMDFRYAIRSFRHAPGFSSTVILTLGLAIGANTAMFSVLSGLLLQPLPFPHPAQLVMLWTERPDQGVRQGRSGYLSIEDWRRQNTSFTDIAFLDPGSTTLASGGDVEQVSIARVSPNFFSVLGVALRGRAFSWEEADARQPVALISHRLWQVRFNGSESAIGASIALDGRSATIVGIVPDGLPFADASVWVPHTLVPDWDTLRQGRGAGPWFVVGRLRPDVPVERARAEVNLAARRLDEQFGRLGAGTEIGVMPLSRYVVGERPRLAVWLLTGAVLCVLVIAAANVAGLLLARSAGRERELAIRSALGASRARMARQLLTESLTLALVASALGLALAVGGLRLLLAIAPAGLPRLNDVRLDGWGVGWTALLCVLTTLVTGLAPALTTARRSLSAATREGGRGVAGGATARRIRRTLVRAELALAIVLLVGAGLLLRSLWSVSQVDRGFSADGVLTLQIASQRRPADRIQNYGRMLDQIARVPGIDHVGMTGDLVISGASDLPVTADGEGSAGSLRLPIRRDEASPGLFDALGTRILHGRAFTDTDGRTAPLVAIVNDTLASRLWPSADPLGKRFKLGPLQAQAPWFTVVGVVGDMRRQGQETPPVAQMFEPLAQNSSRLATIVVKTSDDDPLSSASAIRAAIRQVDSEIAIYGITTLDQRLGAMVALRQFQTYVLMGFAAVALLLSALGTYGLIHYSVVTRRQEIAIRMALGAESRGIFRMVLGEGLRLSLAGLSIGLVGALALGRIGESLLFGITPADPWTFVAVSGLLVGVAMLACYLPARRAMQIDPVTALR